MKVIVLCVWGQLFCSANSTAKHTAKNVTPGDTVDCLITSLSGCHKNIWSLDYEFLFLVRVVGSFPYKIAHVTVGKVSWIRAPGNLSSSD